MGSVGRVPRHVRAAAWDIIRLISGAPQWFCFNLSACPRTSPGPTVQSGKANSLLITRAIIAHIAINRAERMANEGWGVNKIDD